MGLDMYLSESRYLSKYTKTDGKDHRESILSLADLKPWEGNLGSVEVKTEVMYWRKANAIHAWFVANCQNGRDECQATYVGPEQLQELLDLCTKVRVDPSLAAELLPTQDGFFFGGTEYGEWYMEDIKDTEEGLTRVLDEKREGTEFEYRSSW